MKFLRTIAYLACLPILLPFLVIRKVFNWFLGKPEPKPVKIVDFNEGPTIKVLPGPDFENVEDVEHFKEKLQISLKPKTKKDLEKELLDVCQKKEGRNPIDIIADICAKDDVPTPPTNIKIEPQNLCEGCTKPSYTYGQWRADHGPTELSLTVDPSSEWRLRGLIGKRIVGGCTEYYSRMDNVKLTELHHYNPKLKTTTQQEVAEWKFTRYEPRKPELKFSFNPNKKIIYVSKGIKEIETQELYSAWKKWAMGIGISAPAVFDVVGGDPLPGGDKLGSVFTLINGWRIMAQPGVTVKGNLFTKEGDSPLFSI